MSPPETGRRQTWLIIWGALTVAPAFYYVVGTLIVGGASPVPQLPMLRVAFWVIALVELVVGGFLMTRAPRAREGVQGLAAFFGAEGPATPGAFQLGFIIGATLVEACAILGFVLLFLGAPIGEYLPFGAASVAVMVAVGLPTGLRYWRELDGVATVRPPARG